MSPAPEPLTENGRIVAERLKALVVFFGSEEPVAQLATAATETFEGDLLMMQLIVRKHLKAVEFTRAVVCECCAGRGNVALALTRTVLEGAVQLSWAADTDDLAQAAKRLQRILKAGYEAMVDEGCGPLPPVEQRSLDDALSRRVKNPPTMRGAMQAMDARERRTGGKPHWETHYQNFSFASGYVHAGFLGPGVFHVRPDALVIDINPNQRQTTAALRWCLLYFARSVDAACRLAGARNLADHVADEYRALKPVAQRALDDLEAATDPSAGC